jgi:hypothetical protein
LHFPKRKQQIDLIISPLSIKIKPFVEASDLIISPFPIRIKSFVEASDLIISPLSIKGDNQITGFYKWLYLDC